MNKLFRFTFIIAIAAAWTAAPVRANTGIDTWTGGGADSNWSTAGNWTGDNAPPLSNDYLHFAGSTQTENVNDLGGGTQFSVARIVFDSSADSFHLEGDAIGFFNINPSNNVIRNNSTAGQILDFNNSGGVGGAGIVLGGVPLTVDAAAGNIELRDMDIELENFIPHQADLTFDGAFDTTVSGDTRGIYDRFNAGGIIKNGTGTLFLTTDNQYTGGTIINAGTLVVGSIHALGNLAGGTNQVDLNGGQLMTPLDAPIGPYRIPGDFNANGGNLFVQIGDNVSGSLNNDELRVNQSANLTGSTIFVHRVATSTQIFTPGDVVRILHTDNGTVNGTFAGSPDDTVAPNDFNTLIQPFIEYHNTRIDLLFDFALSFQSQAHTPNQIATAENLDDALAAGCIPHATTILGNLQLGPAFRAALDLIAPEELAAIYETSFSSATVQTQNLQRRMNDIRDGSFGFCADGFAIRDEHGMAKDSKGGKDVVEQVTPPNDRWGVFITGTGDLARTSGTYNADGYQLNQGGFTLGADYRVTHNFAIGIDGGFTETRGDLNNNGRLDVDSGKIGLYATFFTDGGFYVDGTASGGWNNYGTRRSAYLGQEHGATDGAEFDGSIAAGYDWKRGCWKFGPIASFEYDYAQFNSFTESDSSLIPLHFPDQNQDAERSNVGLHISHQQNYKGNGCNVISEVRAYWRHDYGDNAYAIDSNFVGCDDVFTVHGPEMGRDSALIDAGLTIMCTRHLSAYFYYDGQYGRDNYYVNAVSGGLRLQF